MSEKPASAGQATPRSRKRKADKSAQERSEHSALDLFATTAAKSDDVDSVDGAQMSCAVSRTHAPSDDSARRETASDDHDGFPRLQAGGLHTQRSEPPSSRKWTDAQLRGIRTVGTNLLVSAAAGSGKTAMLSERCANLVCDAPEPFRCDVDELLVVTFTEAAANEMRGRVAQALRARVGRAGDGDDVLRLRRQLALIDQAQVSTLHSFCSRLLRQHFHVVGLDPAFAVMDAEEARLLRLEVGRQLMADRYELDDGGEFQRLVDAYAEGDDERLLRQVMRVHDLIVSLVDPDAWLADNRQRLVEAADRPLRESHLGGELIDLIGHRLAGLRERCRGALELVTGFGRFPGYVEILRELHNILRHWEEVLGQFGPDALTSEMDAIEWPRLPTVKSDVPHKAVAKAAVESVRKEVKEGSWASLLKFRASEWQHGMREVAPHAITFLGLVQQFRDRYRQEKDRARQLDFADLERYALEVLRDRSKPGIQPSGAARECHRQYKHVLVDEYQDINELQDAIISLVSHERVVRTGPVGPASFANLFFVGDVKQSIYRFRLAESGRFLEREQQWRNTSRGEGEVIDLRENFRSRGPLLEAINQVFMRLMTRAAAEIQYDEKHHLRQGREFAPTDPGICFNGSPIELHLLPADASGHGDDDDDGAPGADEGDLDRTEREAMFVARRVRALLGHDGSPRANVIDDDSKLPRPIQPRDIVVLLRAMKFKADPYAEALRAAGVPSHAESGSGYFESLEVREMMALLALLDNMRQDIPLAAILRGPLGELPRPEDSLARIRLAYTTGEKPMAFHEAVLRYPREHDDELAGHLLAFFAKLERWRQTAHRRPVAETIWSIYTESGYLAYVAGLTGGEQRVANLHELHARAVEFDTHRRQGLSRFLLFLENLRAEADLGVAPVSSEAEDVVRVMSIHHSKGLEFPVVIVPDLGKRVNLQDATGPIVLDRQAGLGMAVVDEARLVRYPSLAQTIVQDRLRRQAMAEEMRVLYVAMTRAKEHLILAGTCKETAAETWRDRWSDHRGPLPADMIVNASSLLDWLGPVASCPPGAGGEFMRVTVHAPGDVAKWAAPVEGAPDQQAEERLAQVAAMQRIEGASSSAAVEAVLERVTFQYPFAAVSRERASRAVSEVAGEARVGAPALAMPRFVARATGAASSAADIGSATHLVLQHLDFSRPLDAADLDAQIAAMVERLTVPAAWAELASRDAIEWFAGTDLGQLMRKHAHRLQRELPIHFTAETSSVIVADPTDRVMIRGRLDVLIPLPQGAVLIDYKTDAVEPRDVPSRAALYTPQLAAYRKAVQRIIGAPPARVSLVFLAARTTCDLE